MISSNSSLKPAGSNPAPKPVQQAQPSPKPATQGFRSTIRQPDYIDQNQTEDAVNNVMAKGHQQADQRYQMKQLDKAGISRGKGQRFIGGQEAVQAYGQAANQAAEMRSQDQLANSKMRSDYERATELEAQNYSMVQHQLSQADWSRHFARQSAAAQLQIAMQNARMNLMTSLIRR
jgi:ABC-type uncharacterized transport system involved in gliding motility auxiliary subunit